MSDLVAELSQRARALPPEDRARLAQELWASLQSDDGSSTDGGWDMELQRRIAEIETGAVELIDGDEVFARVRRSLR